MDVDGVLTDGRIWLLSRRDGTASEIKGFSAYDGAGLKLARAAGLRTGLITGRESSAVAQRARECEIEFVYQHRATKIGALEEILQTTGADASEVAYVGDDLPDIPVLQRVGLARRGCQCRAGSEAGRALCHFAFRRRRRGSRSDRTDRQGAREVGRRVSRRESVGQFVALASRRQFFSGLQHRKNRRRDASATVRIVLSYYRFVIHPAQLYSRFRV